MNEQMTAVLERITAARKNAGLSQTQAGKLLGLQGAQGLCDIEKGRSALTVERLLDMSDVYEMDITWAITGVNPHFDPQPVTEAAQKAGVDGDELGDWLEMLAMLRNNTASE